MNQMIGTYSVARNTRRWLMVTFHTIFNIAGISTQTSYTEQQCENKAHNIYQKSCNAVSVEQIKRHSEITRGVHKTLHQKLHQFQTQTKKF